MTILKKILTLMAYPAYTIYLLAHKYIIAYENFNYDFKKNGENKLLSSLSNKDIMIVFDVGANVGEWTNSALQALPNSKLHAFELSEKTFTTLKENLKNSNRVTLNNVGLADKKSLVKYKDYGQNSGGNTIINESEYHDHRLKPTVKMARVITGTDYCKQMKISHIDLLKIDVEGAEHLVLWGFSELLAKGKIKVIQFEYGYNNGDAKFLMKDFYKLLSNYGYLVGPLKSNGVIFMDFDYGLNCFTSGPNYVAVHESEKEIISAISGKKIKGYPYK